MRRVHPVEDPPVTVVQPQRIAPAPTAGRRQIVAVVGTLIAVAVLVAVAAFAAGRHGSGPSGRSRTGHPTTAVDTAGPGTAHGSLAGAPGAVEPASPIATDPGGDVAALDDLPVEDVTGQHGETTSEEPPAAEPGAALPELVGTVFDA